MPLSRPITDPAPSESDAVRENRHALYRKIDTMERQLGEVHLALVGNAGLGNVGLVKRVETLEASVHAAINAKADKLIVAALAEKVEAHDRKLWLGITVLSALWATVVAFKEKIFR